MLVQLFEQQLTVLLTAHLQLEDNLHLIERQCLGGPLVDDIQHVGLRRAQLRE